MGKKLEKAFDIAREAGGMLLQMRLAMNAGMTSIAAADKPDSPENIAKMEQALAFILRKEIKL